MVERLTRSEVEAMAESPIQANGAKYARALLAAWDALDEGLPWIARSADGGEHSDKATRAYNQARAALPAPEDSDG